MLLKTIDKSKRFFSLILAIVLMVSAMSISVYALTDAEKQEYKNKIEEIKAQIAENNKKIDELKQEAATYDDDIAAYQSRIDVLQEQIDLYNEEIALIDEDISKVDNQIKDIQNEIEGLQKQVKKLDEQIVELEQKKADTYTLLGERIRASYMAGAGTTLEYILTSDDFEFQSYLERVELLQRIAEHDDELITELEKNIEDINKKLAEIEDIKARLGSKIEELDLAKKDYEAKKQEQVDARSVIEKAEAEIQADLNKILAIVNSLDKKSQEYADANDKRMEEINSYEDKLIEQNTHYGDGNAAGMVWPLPYEDAYISSRFKLRHFNGTTRRHNGVDTCRWSGTHGADVIAVKSGTIEVANWGWGGGFGNYVVVNHGDGVLTYYCHLSNITVSSGQKVSQGKVIGQAGNTGYSFGAHLHFGLMINGEWVDPLKYVPNRTPGGKTIEWTDSL